MDSLRISRLTDRQRLCLRHVHAHLSSKEIATKVGIEPGTVDQHIKAAMLILGVCDRRAAARMLVDREAATPDRPIEAPPEAAIGAVSPTSNVVDEILASIRHGLGNLLNFSGRDTREQFRLYALSLLVLAGMIAYFIVQTRFLITFMRVHLVAVGHPELAGDAFQWKRNSPELMPDFSDLPTFLGFITLLHLALIAAAVARRRHDWSPGELCGWLPLPVANVALMVKPALIVVGMPFVTGLVLLYALIRGGAPERFAAAIIVVGTPLTALALSADPARMVGGDLRVFVIDCAAMLGFVLIALRANRLWPIWIAGINSICVPAHLILLMNPAIDPVAYFVVAALLTPFIVLIFLVGTHNHQRRLRKNGVDPAWTPLGRPPRRGAAKPPVERPSGVLEPCASKAEARRADMEVLSPATRGTRRAGQ